MGMSRRQFLLMTGGAGAAVASEPGRKLVNRLIPYVNPPEVATPGEWADYATTCRECPAGCGLLLRHRDGRVTKAEGNPKHPVNRGGLCPRGQSSLQGLYDPDRLKGPLRREGKGFRPVSWEEAEAGILRALHAAGRERIAAVSSLRTGTELQALRGFLSSWSTDRLLLYEPFSFSPLRTAHDALFGRPAIPRYDLSKPRFILSLGADFLESWVSPVEFARGYASMRRYVSGDIALGAFVYAGPRLSMTAANADDYLQTPPGAERWVALALLQEIVAGWRRGEHLAPVLAVLGAKEAAARAGIQPGSLKALARRFLEGNGIALASPTGDDSSQAADAAFAAGLLNSLSGGLAKGVDFSRSHALGSAAAPAEISSFLDRLSSSDVLFIIDTNIAFTRPLDRERLRRAGTVVCLGTLPDETAELADWVLPLDSPLEAWGEYSPYSGMISLQQPTMRRLYDTRMTSEILAALSPGGSPPAGAGVAERLQKRWREDSLTPLLHEGGVLEEPVAPVEAVLRESLRHWRFAPHREEALAAIPAVSINLFDGRTANRGWMQEAPDPVSTAVWGSWADIHPETAKRHGIAEGDRIEIRSAAGTAESTARVTEQVSPAALAVLVGQGHRAKGLSTACGIGDDGFPVTGAVTLRKIAGGRKKGLVRLSATTSQHGRRIIDTVRLQEARRMEPGEGGDQVTLPLPEGYDPKRDLYASHPHRRHRWGMVVDLHRCIGCGACAVACYAENNVGWVGRKRCAEGRELAWLKVPPYRIGDNPLRLRWIPMLCQQCDAAPCEPVCPVYASVHNEEGLNAQVYNRCIGTRYCSNNCPYKVRRFNWYRRIWEKPLDLQLNPEVTVRSQGVMEKCTFCVQRIRAAEYRARVEDRPLRDGEIQPACAQSCPAGVFTFGDLMDPQSRVSKLMREDPRRYQVLHELNTKPAVVYLKPVTQELLEEA